MSLFGLDEGMLIVIGGLFALATGIILMLVVRKEQDMVNCLRRVCQN